MTVETTIQTLAAEARKFFVKDVRTDGTAFWKRTDDAPEWVQNLCIDAHGDMMPDDWRYAFVVEALDALEENEDPDDITLEADIYTSDLTSWLGSRNDRTGYCDEAMEEYGMDFSGIVQVIQLGQLAEKNEVLASVRRSLENQLGELESQDDEDPSEPDEGDWVTEDHITFREHDGRGVVVIPDGEDWQTVLKAKMAEDNFYPNVWSLSDHGNWCLLSLDD